MLKGDLESIAKALTGKRLPYAYLIWKNARFKSKPDPRIPELRKKGGDREDSGLGLSARLAA